MLRKVIILVFFFLLTELIYANANESQFSRDPVRIEVALFNLDKKLTSILEKTDTIVHSRNAFKTTSAQLKAAFTHLGKELKKFPTVKHFWEDDYNAIDELLKKSLGSTKNTKLGQESQTALEDTQPLLDIREKINNIRKNMGIEMA